MSPAELLAAGERGEMSLPHPTRCNLVELDARLRVHGSLAGLLQGERERRAPPILPKVVELGEQRSVLMPWDPEYQLSAGEGTPPEIQFTEELRALPARVEHGRG
jgi:hypothetical protein